MSKRKSRPGNDVVVTGRLKKAAKSVRQIVREEVDKMHDLKGVDTYVNVGTVLATLNTNANFILLNSLAEGSGNYRRQDANIKMKSLRFRGNLAYTYNHKLVDGNIFGDTMRISLIYEKETQGAAPTWDTVFANLDNTGAVSTNFWSSVNYNETKRFRVLREFVITMNPPAENTKGLLNDYIVLEQDIDFYVDLKGLSADWNRQQSTGTIADMAGGALWLVPRAHISTSPHATMSLEGSARLRFIDA